MATAKKRTTKSAGSRSGSTTKAKRTSTAKTSKAKKPAAKKTTAKTAAKRTAAKTTAKKTAAKRTAAKKTTAKKAAAKKTAAKKATAKKTAAKKTAAKKTTAKKPAAKKTAAKKTAAKKPAAKKTAAKKTTAKKTAAKKTTAKRTTAKRSKSKRKVASPDVRQAEVALFEPPTEGERADALRVLLEDPRLAQMASVGRYRVIAVEPQVVKPPHALAASRLLRVVIYDYAGDRSVDACIDLDTNSVTHLTTSRAQPMLAREEEAAAIATALADERVKAELSLGDEPQVAMHYWSRHDTDLSYARRSAAVIFGGRGERPSVVAVVDLIDDLVCKIVPAAQW